MTHSDIQDLERLVDRVRSAREKRDRKESHEASLLEFMCAETRLATWLRDHAEDLLESAKSNHLCPDCNH